MMNPESSKRAMTGVCSSDCIMLLLNKTVFDTLVRDKIKRTSAELANLVYKTIPDINKGYSFAKVLRGASHLFKTEVFSKGHIVSNETKVSEKLYLIKSGSIALTKRLSQINELDQKVLKPERLLNLQEGEFFGGDFLLDRTMLVNA